MRGRTVVGIDVGSSKVSTLIADVSDSDTLHVIGVGAAPTRGIRKGVVVNIDEAISSIRTAVEKAERVSGFKIVSAYLGLSGSHMTSLNNRGVVAIAHDDRTIRHEDLARVVESARVINLTPNREIVHAIPRHFIIDGQDGVKNPIGMIGYRLDVEAHIVTAAVTPVQNLTKCIHQLGIDVDEMVFSPLASAEAVLTSEERDLGVLLVDIGGGTTDLAMYIDGGVWHTTILPTGGDQISKDIAVQLRTPFAEAEELKVEYGHCQPTNVDPDEEIEAATFGQNKAKKIRRRLVCEVMESRVKELIRQIETEIKRSGYDSLLPAGLVLTGGVAQTLGLADVASEMLDMPVRIGTPSNLRGLTDNITTPTYATNVGLLLWAARYAERSWQPSQPVASGWRQRTERHNNNGDAAGKIKGWLKAFLP